MIRSTTRVNGQTITSPVAHAAIKLFLGTLALAVGSGLLYVRHVTLRDIRAAREWVEVPCAIERCEFLRDDDGERYLVVEFSYTYAGQSYRSDRLDLLPGRMGDDDAWEKGLERDHPAGSEAVCYVDPNDPGKAVLDREHGTSGANNLRLLGSPFLFAGCAMWFSQAYVLIAQRLRPKPLESALADSIDALPPPPRHVALGKALAFALATPPMVQLAWAFLVGFAFVFRFLEGPAMIRDWIPSQTVLIEATITRVDPLNAFEFTQQVVEYQFQFNLEGTQHTGKSHRSGTHHAVGDRVEIVVDPERPDSAHIAGTRRREAPGWVAAIPGAVVLLLAFGIVASYAFNLWSLSLIRNGAPAKAVRDDAALPTDAEHEVDLRAGPSSFTFEIEGRKYAVDPRSHPSSNGDDVPVLYNPARPQRNLGLSVHQLAILVGGKNAWIAAGVSLIVPVVCFSVVCWLLGWS